MKVIRSIKLLQTEMSNLKNKQIGLVPTMGFLHEGHISLIKTAKDENNIVVASIFVNPLQFGPNEDFEKYPRDEDQDMKLAEQFGVDILFIPDVQEMYPNEMSISMRSEKRVDVLCGRSRPGHFDGVVTVLTKLFNMIQPNKVYFGMKDAQQVAVVDGLITDFNFPIELIGLPTIREKSGLAKSSRNVYLSNEESNAAVWLYKALTIGRQLVVDGEKNPANIVNGVMKTITKETKGIIDYVELLSYPELQPITEMNQQIILAIAVQFKHARLIDNLLFDGNGKIVERLS